MQQFGSVVDEFHLYYGLITDRFCIKIIEKSFQIYILLKAATLINCNSLCTKE